jgi:type I restriction enzyme S subunit
MSGVGLLDKLLDGAAVEWKPLGEAVDFLKGKSLPKEKIVDGGYNKCIHYGELFTHYPAVINEIKSRTNQSLDESVLSKANDVLVPTSDVTPDGLATASCLAEDNVILGGDILVIRGDVIDGRYLSHFIRKSKSKIMQMVSGSTVYHIYAKDLGKLQVPIPCPDNSKKSLEIQAEIVRILDAFTELTSELTTELTARKKQYNHYRDQLLSFEDGEVEWKTLGEMALIQRGASPRPIARFITDDENAVPWIKIGDTSLGSKYVNETAQKITLEGARSSRLLDKGDFILSNSMSFGRPYILGISGAIHDGWASISKFSGTLNTDFLYHYLSSNKVQNYWSGKINSGSVSNLNADIIKALPVPTPSFARQKKIAALLDKFDELTNSLTEGLPREIELRQKQYAYYRDLLFSFPKPARVS